MSRPKTMFALVRDIPRSKGKVQIDYQSFGSTPNEVRENVVDGLIIGDESAADVWKGFEKVGWRVSKVKVTVSLA